jgi:hypothetical protein
MIYEILLPAITVAVVIGLARHQLRHEFIIGEGFTLHNVRRLSQALANEITRCGEEKRGYRRAAGRGRQSRQTLRRKDDAAHVHRESPVRRHYHESIQHPSANRKTRRCWCWSIWRILQPAISGSILTWLVWMGIMSSCRW